MNAKKPTDYPIRRQTARHAGNHPECKVAEMYVHMCVMTKTTPSHPVFFMNDKQIPSYHPCENFFGVVFVCVMLVAVVHKNKITQPSLIELLAK